MNGEKPLDQRTTQNASDDPASTNPSAPSTSAEALPSGPGVPTPDVTDWGVGNPTVGDWGISNPTVGDWGTANPDASDTGSGSGTGSGN